MSKLLLNEDGSVTIPLRDVIGADGPKARPPIVLSEPGVKELAEIRALTRAVDKSLPPVIPIDTADATDAEVVAATERLNERGAIIYSDDAPYMAVLLQVITMLAPHAKVDMSDLPGWCASPAALNAIIAHFQTPLVG